MRGEAIVTVRVTVRGNGGGNVEFRSVRGNVRGKVRERYLLHGTVSCCPLLVP